MSRRFSGSFVSAGAACAGCAGCGAAVVRAPGRSVRRPYSARSAVGSGCTRSRQARCDGGTPVAGSLRGRSRGADADRARYTGAAEATVAVRILAEVLLVVVLGI